MIDLSTENMNDIKSTQGLLLLLIVSMLAYKSMATVAGTDSFPPDKPFNATVKELSTTSVKPCSQDGCSDSVSDIYSGNTSSCPTLNQPQYFTSIPLTMTGLKMSWADYGGQSDYYLTVNTTTATEFLFLYRCSNSYDQQCIGNITGLSVAGGSYQLTIAAQSGDCYSGPAVISQAVTYPPSPWSVLCQVVSDSSVILTLTDPIHLGGATTYHIDTYTVTYVVPPDQHDSSVTVPYKSGGTSVYIDGLLPGYSYSLAVTSTSYGVSIDYIMDTYCYGAATVIQSSISGYISGLATVFCWYWTKVLN